MQTPVDPFQPLAYGEQAFQEVCHAWIEAQTPINEVLMNLELANFDAEFSKMYEPQLRQVYENQTGQKLPTSAAKRNLWAVFKHFGRKRL